MPRGMTVTAWAQQTADDIGLPVEFVKRGLKNAGRRGFLPTARPGMVEHHLDKAGADVTEFFSTKDAEVLFKHERMGCEVGDCVRHPFKCECVCHENAEVTIYA